jgi:protein phosphatase
MDSTKPATSSKHLTWFGETDRGRVRSNNEDAFLGLQFDAKEVHRLGKFGDAATGTTDFVFAVSDGMGGARAGEFASRIAVEKITTLLPYLFRQSAGGLAGGFEDVLTELFSETHRALAYLGGSDPECAGMEATLSLCWFTPGWMYYAHIGDSRIYYLPARGGEIKRLSQDDTHVDWLFRNGQINEREARTHPRRKVLQKALGGDNQFVNPQLGAVAYESGDIFLLCTDGLVEGLYDQHIVELLTAGETAGPNANPARQLVAESVAKDGGDNTTALVIRVS